ncbi:hypothetical protein TorRG33x02_353700 [Trema orientale]|uniref:Uncharacterized protein n=1 Tax=Trema orientale TaxID=63057 RepID=A0A2P5ACH8_TREOI|nr:hypothetical protein TorRG33x02_353700 [Trema orientale]
MREKRKKTREKIRLVRRLRATIMKEKTKKRIFSGFSEYKSRIGYYSERKRKITKGTTGFSHIVEATTTCNKVGSWVGVTLLFSLFLNCFTKSTVLMIEGGERKEVRIKNWEYTRTWLGAEAAASMFVGPF